MDKWDCPAEGCEECEFHRSVSWCAQAIPKPQEINDAYKAHMEGFWEAMTYAEEHYKVMENFYDNTNDYIVALEKLIDLCYADGRAPTAEEVAIIDNFWNGDE